MKRLSKLVAILTLLMSTSTALYAHVGSHQMGMIEILRHYLSNPFHLGIMTAIAALILALIVKSKKGKS